MWYELWDVQTQNRVARYEGEREALTAVLEEIRRYGSDSAEVLNLALLGCDASHEQDGLIAMGPALAALAGALTPNEPTHSRTSRRV